MFELGAVKAGRGQLRPRVLPQRVGLIHIGCRRDAGVVAPPGLLPGGVELRDRVLEQFHDRIIAAQAEVVGGQLRLQRQFEGRHIRRTGLRASIGFGRHIAQAAEKVDLPGHIQRGDEIIAGPAGREIRTIKRGASPDRRSIRTQGRILPGAGFTGQRAGLLKAGQDRAQVQIAGMQLLLELVELRITKGLPPVGPGLVVGRSGRRPVAGLLIYGDLLVEFRRHIGGRQRAGTEHCRDRACNDNAFHDQAPAAGLGAWTTRTLA